MRIAVLCIQLLSMSLSCTYIITRTSVSPDVYMRLYSLSSLKKDTATPHPTAILPLIRLDIDSSGEPSGVYELQIVRDHVIFEMCLQVGAIRSYSIDVYNWKTAQPVSVRIAASLA